MIKQSTTAGSNYMMVSSWPLAISRCSTTTTDPSVAATYTFPNLWMKLVSLNGKVTAYASADGVTWTKVLSKTLAITSPATIGLFECSHKSGRRHGDFDNVSFTPGP